MEEWLEWLERAARAIGEEPASDGEVGAALGLARESAHGVDRRTAPVIAYLAGVQVGRRVAAGGSRGNAFDDVLAAVRPLIPPPAAGGDRPG